jgi:MoaA/NifB/PqqE/SkfB family radical SAM enzyme
MHNETNITRGSQTSPPGSSQEGLPDFSNIMNEYRHRTVRVKSGPSVIYLESVSGCPFSCAMCKPGATKPQRVSTELLKRMEPALANLEVLAIHGQGEPLMADLEYFINRSMKYDFVLHIDTNGLLLTDDVANLLLRTRLSIRFSIHAGRPQTYYRLMGVDLEKVKQNIRNLVQKSKKSPRRNDFWFSFIVMKENIHEIEDFLHLAYECDIHSVRFMHLWSNNDTLKGINVRGMYFKYSEQASRQVRNEFAEYQSRYKTIADQLGIRIEWGDALNYDYSVLRNWGELANKVSHRLTGKWFFPLVPAKGHCAAPWLGQFRVNYNGNVSLCCLSSTVLGNVYHSSLSEIWHGSHMTRIRQAFFNGYYPHECGYCRGFGLNNYPNNSFINIKR